MPCRKLTAMWLATKRWCSFSVASSEPKKKATIVERRSGWAAADNPQP